MSEKFRLFSVAGILTFLLTVILIVVFLDSSIHDPFVEHARDLGRVIVWDIAYGGKVEWRGYQLKFEKGKFGWVIGDLGGLSVFPRPNPHGAVADLRIDEGTSREDDMRTFVEALCVDGKCRELQDISESVDGISIKGRGFIHSMNGPGDRKEAYLYAGALGLSIHISAPPKEFPSTKELALNIVSQVASQHRANEPIRR